MAMVLNVYNFDLDEISGKWCWKCVINLVPSAGRDFWTVGWIVRNPTHRPEIRPSARMGQELPPS
jgi:hypothetical protein